MRFRIKDFTSKNELYRAICDDIEEKGIMDLSTIIINKEPVITASKYKIDGSDLKLSDLKNFKLDIDNIDIYLTPDFRMYDLVTVYNNDLNIIAYKVRNNLIHVMTNKGDLIIDVFTSKVTTLDGKAFIDYQLYDKLNKKLLFTNDEYIGDWMYTYILRNRFDLPNPVICNDIQWDDMTFPSEETTILQISKKVDKYSIKEVFIT